jgi:hypothetical protein
MTAIARPQSTATNESNNRITNTAWTPSTAGMLSKVGKPAKACREANYSRDTINIRSEAVAEKIGTSGMSTAAGPPELDSRTPTIMSFHGNSE